MNQKTGQNSKKRKRAANTNNFLEALRDLGGGVIESAVHDVAGSIPSTAFDQISGRQGTNSFEPDQALEMTQVVQENQQTYQEQKDRFRHFQREFLDIQHEERLIYKQSEQETKVEIAAVLEELKKLSVSTKNLAKEVEIAAQQVPVDPGTYHLNFFKRLRQTIIFLKKKVDESATWLSAFNQKGKKRNLYWSQVKKSGTKFMLSQERYMATQAG